ncbi:MAG: hypothetical protein LJF15_10930 [Acidobacteria bacterium]|jgi:hypothetical protein|nr:hypothetical protein [Acidobacteriota bacterium]
MTPAQRLDSGHPSAARGTLVAVHRGHLGVEKALDELARSHFALRLVSVVGADYHTQSNVYGYYSAGRRFEAWGSFGAFWSGVWAALTGEGFFFIPHLGPLLMAGPVVGWLVEALETGAMVHDLSPLGAALVANGVPEDGMHQFEVALRGNEFLLIVSGPLPAMEEARALVEPTGARVSVYPA